MSNNNHYSQEHCRVFITLLGCWRFSDPYRAVIDRDPHDYQILLIKLIKANETRDDRIGFWETAEAMKALKALSKTPP